MDNKDLMTLEEQIQQRKALEVTASNPVDFKPLTSGKKKDKASELVENAFSHAIVNRVTENENIQKELLEGADKVIDNKVQEILSKAEEDSKTAHFNNKKGACECFGYNETTTEKWAVNMMNIWHNVMTAVWLFVGFFTFAPIVFIAKKISVIFTKTWIAITIAILIYLGVTFIPILTGVILK